MEVVHTRAGRPWAVQVCSVIHHLTSLRGVLPEAEFLGADDIHVAACTCDSRQVRPGSLFAAVPGNRRDGRNHQETMKRERYYELEHCFILPMRMG